MRHAQPTQPHFANERQQMLAWLNQALPVIEPLIEQVKAAQHAHDWAGSTACPMCEGTLHLTHAAQTGSVQVRCATADCLCIRA
jgi:hypothetical protein